MNLELQSGQVLALVGQSGGGKSTIAHLIEGFYRPTSGKILLDDQDVADMDPRQLRRLVGIVNQEPTLFACSIADNIAYGTDISEFANEQERMKAIVKAAKMANAHEFISQFPQQYNTLVGERGIRLSGGQKQRIAIARALLIGMRSENTPCAPPPCLANYARSFFSIDPKILLLDEATSALDAESEYLVKQALDELLRTSAHQRTVLVIAHRLSTVKNANQVAVIVKGKLVEQGSHDELISADGPYKKLVSRQMLTHD